MAEGLQISYIFLRHAHAQSGADDQSRLLTDRGLMQAKGIALKLKNSHFDLVICSTAVRARDTAKIIMRELNNHASLVELEEIYLPVSSSDRQEVERILAKYPGQPLKEYIGANEVSAWKRYAQVAFNAITSVVSKYQANKILIVGHGNIINAVGLLIDSNAKTLEQTYFENCQGFKLKSGEFAGLFLDN